MNSSQHSQNFGKLAEEKALNYLTEKGLKTLTRNFYCRSGEIDLVMQDDDVIVFIEVRARTTENYMNALETINQKKITRIIHTSQHYLQKNKQLDKSICRFDVVILIGPLETAKIEWIKNAFEA